MAYLFDRTPFYRPWLAWMRVDVRRAGPDLVYIISHANASAEFQSADCDRETVSTREPLQTRTDITPRQAVSAPRARLAARRAPARHLLCALPRMVVLAQLAGPFTRRASIWAAYSPARATPPASAGHTRRPHQVRRLPALPEAIGECDGAAHGLRVLLHMHTRARRAGRDVPCYFTARGCRAVAQDHDLMQMIALLLPSEPT